MNTKQVPKLREIPKEIDKFYLEQAFNAGREKFQNKVYTFDSFYDYMKSLIKK
jgi:hypothetical protein